MIEITFDSGAAVSAMPKDTLPNAKQREWRTDERYGGEKVAVWSKFKNASTQSMNLRLVDVTKALAPVNKICQRKNRVVADEEGSYIENKALGR